MQHPAILEAGTSVGKPFFAPMYKRAAPLQITLAFVGFISGLFTGLGLMNGLWLVGSLALVSVIPITLIFIKPINDVLLSAKNHLGPIKIQSLLHRWGVRHWIRTLVSGIAFVLYLLAAMG